MVTDDLKLQAKIEELQQQLAQKDDEIYQLKNVISNLPGSIYWKDKDGVYLGRNNFSSQKMRQDKFEDDEAVDWVIGKTDHDIFSSDIADKFRQNDLQVINEGIESVTEEPLHLPDGREIVQLSTKRPLYNSKGEIVGIVGNTVDITYLKRIETELRDAKVQAEEASNLKLQFMRNMEHDIRTPFSGVIGMANYLLQNETDATKKECISDILLASTQLLEYCNSILDFSRMEHGVDSIICRDFNLQQLIDKVLQMEDRKSVV